MTFSPRRTVLPVVLWAASVLGACLQAGCGPSSSPSPPLPPPPTIAAPADLGYGTTPAVYPRGTAIVANAPHSSGGAVASYGIAPALPPGLALDPTTGVISGTPSAITPQASYTVTAANAGGSATCTLVVTITDAPPAGLAYGVPQGVYTKGVTIAANAPTSTGGAVAGYLVAPALPAGLAMDLTTGVISGTPTTVAARFTYTVMATNSDASATAGLEITVKDVAPGALAYAANPASYFLSAPIAPNTPASSGSAFSTYRVSPALPAGLLLDAATGVLTGTPLLTGQGTFRVTASNSGGSASCDLALTVVAPPPSQPHLCREPAHHHPRPGPGA